LAIHRLRDQLSLLLERPGGDVLEDGVSLLHLAPELSEVVPMLRGEMAIQLLEEPVFDLPLALQEVQDPLQFELVRALVIQLPLQVFNEHVLVPPLESLIRLHGDLVQPRLGASALHPFEHSLPPAERLSQLVQQSVQLLLVIQVPLGHSLLRFAGP
jgi:hypothetical protein